MCLCFLCPGDPIETDVRKDNGQTFKVNMLEAPTVNPLCCLGACLCPCCAQIYIRRKALDNDMSRYACCQGYMDGAIPCFRSGQCGEASCPDLCLCMEAFCCNGCAVSSTRMLVMDRHNLRPDEWDNRIVRWNNCVQMASIVCDLFSICVPELKDLAKILDCVAHCSYAATQGCMTAQVDVELDARKHDNSAKNEAIERV